MNEQLISEVQKINDEAFGMALDFVKNPRLRESLGERAKRLYERAHAIHDELEESDPDTLDAAGEMLSESILDLAFVQKQTTGVSMRIGRAIKFERDKHEIAKGLPAEVVADLRAAGMLD